METENHSKPGKPANAEAGPLSGVPLEGHLTPARARPEPAGGEGRKRSPSRDSRAWATVQGLYSSFQAIRLEAEALRDALAAKRP